MVKNKRHSDKITTYNELPLKIKSEIIGLISFRTVALIGYNENHIRISNLLASGTFTTINSKYGVLTAKHVWDKFKKKAFNISFSFLGKTHYTYERIEYLNCYAPENDKIDVCFIELSPRILGTIKAASDFYPILSESYSESINIRKRLCITVGFPLEIQPRKENKIHILRYFTHIKQHYNLSKDWDRIELDIQENDKQKELPENFGGMSGGGIWSIKGFYNEKGFFIRKNTIDFLLVGVNYFQKTSNGKVHTIYGIGPKTIYSRMTKLISK